MFAALLALQAFHVLFLALHDWVPLGRWNNVVAARATDPGTRLLTVTVLSTVPYAIGLVGSAWSVNRLVPGWLSGWLWVSYALLFAGELRAWWVPYLVHAEPERAARYQRSFQGTYNFLPVRNGIPINALHVLLHVATLATLLLLAAWRR